MKRFDPAKIFSTGFPGLAMISGAALLLASCVSSDVLESASSSSATSTEQAQLAPPVPQPAPEVVPEAAPEISVQPASTDIMAVNEPAPTPATSGQTNLAALQDPDLPSVEQGVLVENPSVEDDLSGQLQIPAANAPRKTYLINGLLSAVPFIGYGFRNLKKKMPEAKLYSYMGVVEGPAVIAPTIVKDAEAAYRRDPTTKINLIGISLGADLITVIAEKLNAKNVPVNYLGIVDGTNLRPITPNVRVADNLTCSFLDCTKARARLTRGNTTTQLTRKVYKSSHIPLGDHDGLHAHVIARSK